MSPDANNGRENEQVTKSKFDTSVHPEGVRRFKRHSDLSDVARITEEGELHTNLEIPEHAGLINPHTHEVAVEKIEPLPATDKKSLKGLLFGLGSAAAGVGVTVATLLAASGGSSEEPRNTRPTATATATPGGEVSNPTSESSPSLEPSPSESSEVKPITPEAIVADIEHYPTATEAIIPLFQQVDAYNNFYTGKIMDWKVQEEHDKMLEAVFGPETNRENVQSFIDGQRAAWSETVDLKSLTQVAIEGGADIKMFEAHMVPTDIRLIGESTVDYTMDLSTNAHETGVDSHMSTEYAAAIEGEFTGKAVLAQEGGRWYIKEYYVYR